jgi:hypothetical protein
MSDPKTQNPNVPFQVQNLLDSLLNTKDNVYVRQNFRMRLDSIRREIDTAIRKFDNEIAFKGKKKA